MDELYSWLRTIAVFMIILPVISQILSNAAYKKYIHYFTGLLFLLILIQPITHVFSLDSLLEEKLKGWDLEMQMEEIEQEEIRVDTTPESILNAEEGDLNTWLTALASQYQFRLEDCQASLCTDISSEKYGTIDGLSIWISDTDTEFTKFTKEEDRKEFFRKEILEELSMENDNLKVYLS